LQTIIINTRGEASYRSRRFTVGQQIFSVIWAKQPMEHPTHTEKVLLDTPVSVASEDHFQRYGYAERIAALINQADYDHSLVIGIYGKWGEGKSSLLNFIGKEIQEGTVQIRFNPWYFKDDNQLMKGFFESIAKALGEKLTKNKDEVVKAFADYGESIGNISNWVIPGSGVLFKAGSKVASTFKRHSLEHYKNRVRELIKRAGRNFVIFIDDIDRLNINDIQSVFKLVKLVGDFPKFTYVLAFDDELVAASLGHQFGEKSIKDGYDFLEKIIQVPLTLPKATPADLRKYALDLIDKVLDNNKVVLNQADTERFLGRFDGAFVPALKSPRLAVRLANAIAFSIPLLQGEVNIGDLMILDAIKVFYPELYHFMRQNGAIFLTNYDVPIANISAHKERAKKELESVLHPYGETLTNQIKVMLSHVFPQLGGLYNNNFPSRERFDQWYQAQQICSHYYFERYFTFSVSRGEITDVYFQQLFADLDKMNPGDFATRLLGELEKLNINEFIFKLRHRTDAFRMAEAANLPLALARIGRMLPEQEQFSLAEPKEELAKIVKRLTAKLDPDNRYQVGEDVLRFAQPLNYKIALYFRLVKSPDPSVEEPFLTPAEIEALDNVMIEEFEHLNHSVNVMRELPDHVLHSMFAVYDKVNQNERIMVLAQTALQHDPQFTLKFLKIFTPTHWSSAEKGPIKTFFRVEDYQFMSRFIDPAAYYQKLVTMHNKRTIINGRALSFGDSLTDDELIAQFQELHEQLVKPVN
jgi:hypothetical protein